MQSVTPNQLVPITFSANEVLDSGSPLYCYIKVPTAITSVKQAIVSLAIRQFFATATAASSGGASTSGSGGSSTPTSGASSSATSTNDGSHIHVWATGISTTPSATATSQKHQDGAASTNKFNMTAEGTGNNFATSTTSAHSHTNAHTHDVTITAHTHTTPDHTHGLTYGTFEEAMPASWSVKLRIYKLIAGVWTLQYTSAAQTTIQGDIDVTSIITGPGDWRLTVLSDAATPNGGRVSCDLYGAITAQIG